MASGPVSLLPSRREYLHINVFPSSDQVADGPFFVINPDRIPEDSWFLIDTHRINFFFYKMKYGSIGNTRAVIPFIDSNLFLIGHTIRHTMKIQCALKRIDTSAVRNLKEIVLIIITGSITINSSLMKVTSFGHMSRYWIFSISEDHGVSFENAAPGLNGA